MCYTVIFRTGFKSPKYLYWIIAWVISVDTNLKKPILQVIQIVQDMPDKWLMGIIEDNPNRIHYCRKIIRVYHKQLARVILHRVCSYWWRASDWGTYTQKLPSKYTVVDSCLSVDNFGSSKHFLIPFFAKCSQEHLEAIYQGIGILKHIDNCSNWSQSNPCQGRFLSLTAVKETKCFTLNIHDKGKTVF